MQKKLALGMGLRLEFGTNYGQFVFQFAKQMINSKNDKASRFQCETIKNHCRWACATN